MAITKKRRNVVAELAQRNQQPAQPAPVQPAQAPIQSARIQQPGQIQSARIQQSGPIAATGGQVRNQPSYPGAPMPQVQAGWTPQNKLAAIAGQQVSTQGGVTGTKEQRYAYNRSMLDMRAKGQAVESFDAWRQKQSGVMAFDWKGISTDPAGMMSARQHLDRVKIQSQVDAVKDDGGTATYYDNLARVYATAGKEEQAAAMRERAFSIRKMNVEAGHDKAADSRKSADNELQRTMEQGQWKKEFDQSVTEHTDDMEIARDKLAVEREKITATEASKSATSAQTAEGKRRGAALTSLEKRLDRLDKRGESLQKRAWALEDTIASTETKDAGKEAARADMAGIRTELDKITNERQKILGDIDAFVGVDAPLDQTSQVYYNPETGEEIQNVNGKWVPVEAVNAPARTGVETHGLVPDFTAEFKHIPKKPHEHSAPKRESAKQKRTSSNLPHGMTSYSLRVR